MCHMHMSKSPTYLLDWYIDIKCIYCMIDLKNPMPVQQPTDANAKRRADANAK